MQYRNPDGSGPSGNTCPRCESAFLDRTSMRRIPWLESSISTNASAEIGSKKLGQPLPESNFAVELNNGSPDTTSTYIPSALWLQKALSKGRSVPLSLTIRYCSGVSSFLSDASSWGSPQASEVHDSFCSIESSENEVAFGISNRSINRAGFTERLDGVSGTFR